MQYTQLSIEEREKIQLCLWEKKSARQIAKELNRSVSTISREIKKNTSHCHGYISRAAHSRALVKRKSRGRKDRLKNQQIRDYVISHLKQRWSPEQIAGRIKIDLKQTISYEAIYQFIYAQIHRDGYGYIKSNKEDLRYCLRRRRRRRVPHGARRCQRVLRASGLSIELRPKVVNERVRVGDWESDSVMSKDNKVGINTFVERKVGLVFITRLKDKTAESTVSAIESKTRFLPRELKQTATFDNGKENSKWDEFQQRTGITCYYAHPYCSGERGTNENTNGLIRDFYPKKTDFALVSDQQLQAVQDSLNNRPRKRLNWLTPNEAFTNELNKLNIKIQIPSVALLG